MDPITLVLSALKAGTTPDVGMLSMIPDDIRNVYGELSDLVAARLGEVGATGVLEQYLAQPDVWEGALVGALQEAHVDQDGDLLNVAQQMLEMTNVKGATRGDFDIEFGDDEQA